MTDQPEETETRATEAPVGETPAQKALRMKKAKLDARPKPPRGGRFQREQAAGIAAGANRPWTHK
jgi:hypothetical protein